MKIIDLVYFNAGGGHRASALALEAIALQQQRPWQIRLINLFDVLDPAKRFQALTGLNPEDLYNKRLARGWTRSMGQELRVLQQLIRLSHPRLVQTLAQHWRKTRPDMVVSLVPNFNRAMYEGLRKSNPSVPYVTVLTDFADLDRKHFWIEEGQQQHFICGTQRAVKQASQRGHTAAYIHATSGMLVRPEFYAPVTQSREQAMHQHNLNPDLPTGLVLFGGHGSSTMLHIEKALPNTQLIFLCGHNQTLVKNLQARARTAQTPRLIQGFTSDVPSFMRLADFFIGKPGPGSISEALCCNLPVILLNAGNTMLQERYNVQWVEENKLGLACRSHRQMTGTVHALLENLTDFKRNVANVRNQALFEVPDILAEILAQPAT